MTRQLNMSSHRKEGKEFQEQKRGGAYLRRFGMRATGDIRLIFIELPLLLFFNLVVTVLCSSLDLFFYEHIRGGGYDSRLATRSREGKRNGNGNRNGTRKGTEPREERQAHVPTIQMKVLPDLSRTCSMPLRRQDGVGS